MRLERYLHLLFSFACAAAMGCAPELTLEPPIDLTKVVEAQFDPAPEIPVLALVPSPTGLAQNADGSPGLNVTVYPCERPTAKQCLAYATGWPTTMDITLYFSGPIDESTIKDGVRLYQVSDKVPIPTLVDFEVKAILDPRPPPPSACMTGGNGKSKATYTEADLQPGIAVILKPVEPLKPGTNHVLLVESHRDGGLRAKNGSVVQPSSLFALMNAPIENEPVTVDGQIRNPLLRSEIQGKILAAMFPEETKTYAELTKAERAVLDARVVATATTSMVSLYHKYFNPTIDGLAKAGFTSRDKLVFVNAWRTAEAPPVAVSFSPQRELVPFPNNELLTQPNGADSTELFDVQLSLPIKPLCPNDVPAPGCDTQTSAGVKQTMNTTLDGFSTSAGILVPTTGDIDGETLADNVVLYPLGQNGRVDGTNVPVDAVALDATESAPSMIRITPLVPLEQNKLYVVAVLSGVLDTHGQAVTATTTYQLLQRPQPLIDSSGKVDAAIEPLLSCSTVATRGVLATPQEVAGTAMLLEQAVVGDRPGLNRPRWQKALEALENIEVNGVSMPIPRSEVLLAFTVKTQSVTKVLDAVRRPDGMPGAIDGWDAVSKMAGLVRVSPPVPIIVETDTGTVSMTTLTGTTAIYGFLNSIVDAVVPDSVDAGNGLLGVCAVAGINCARLFEIYAGSIREIRKHMVTLYKITSGNPFTAGYLNPNKFDPRSATFVPPDFEIVPMWVVLPANTSTAPVTIFQHGFGATKETGFLLANTFAAAGQATVMIDLPFHGARASDVFNDTAQMPCTDVDPARVVCDDADNCVACDQNGMNCRPACDGIRDGSGVGFMSPNLFGTRDNFRQAIIDHLVLLRALAELAHIDARRVSVVGQSLGGMSSANLAAYAPELNAVVLNATGGRILDYFEGTSPRIKQGMFAALGQTENCELIDPLRPEDGCKDTAKYRQFRYIAQWILDPGDPFANATTLRGPIQAGPGLGPDGILVQMVIPDRVTPIATSHALGRAYDFDPSDNSQQSHFQTWNISPSATADCHSFLVNPACDWPANDLLARLNSICASFGAQQQAATFVSTGMISQRTANLPLAQLGIPGIQGCPTF